MNPIRILLGMVTASLLVPAVAFVLSDQSAVISQPAALGEPVAAVVETSAGVDQLRLEALEPSSTDSDDATDPTQQSASSESSTVNAQETDGSQEQRENPTHDSHTSSSTTDDVSDGDEDNEVVVDGSITGEACPCRVTGTVELVGSISLSGDLVVEGGTLVARPGVDLNGNGHQIMFMAGGVADFQGTKTSTWSGNGSNANVSRDITFRNLRRIMFHEGAGPSTLRYIAVVDAGTSGVLGDYPLHWHRNGSSTRGTVVEGVAVVNGRHHAFVPHASHGITFIDTIAKNTLEEAYWWDTPTMDPCSGLPRFCTANNSNDITIRHALADGIKSAGSGYRISAFLLGAGSGNSITNSGARNVMKGKQCSAFHWPEAANQNDGGLVWRFQNNFATGSGCPTGIFVWQNGAGDHVVDGFASDLAVDHGAYSNDYTYVNLDVDGFRGHALGYAVRDSQLGHVVLEGHPLESDPVRFSNVQMASLTIDDGDSVEPATPGVYIFENSNITCDGVIYEDVAPGTVVIVDGTEC